MSCDRYAKSEQIYISIIRLQRLGPKAKEIAEIDRVYFKSSSYRRLFFLRLKTEELLLVMFVRTYISFLIIVLFNIIDNLIHIIIYSVSNRHCFTRLCGVRRQFINAISCWPISEDCCQAINQHGLSISGPIQNKLQPEASRINAPLKPLSQWQPGSN